MSLPVAWISEGWIFSEDPAQNGRYWIHDNWIWGPAGAADAYTGYWINTGWIWGPAGPDNAMTGFFVREDWIFGPDMRLPFVK